MQDLKVSHNDLHTSNVVINEHGALKIIDWT